MQPPTSTECPPLRGPTALLLALERPKDFFSLFVCRLKATSRSFHSMLIRCDVLYPLVMALRHALGLEPTILRTRLRRTHRPDSYAP